MPVSHCEAMHPRITAGADYGRLNRALRICTWSFLLAGPLFAATFAYGQSGPSIDTCQKETGTNNWYKWSYQRTNETPGNVHSDLIYPNAIAACSAGVANAANAFWVNPDRPYSTSKPESGNPHCRVPAGATPLYTTPVGYIARTLVSNPAVNCPANPLPSIPVNPSDDTCRLGNPCSAATGAKYLDETDYAGPSGIELRRSYSTARSYQDGLVTVKDAFGTASWLHTYERSLHQYDPAVTGGIKWVAKRHDGQLLYFLASGLELQNRSHTGASSIVTPLPSSLGWTLQLPNGDIEKYNPNSTLASITTRAGVLVTVKYDHKARVIRVVNSFGHDLDFFYDAQNRLNLVRDPAGGDTQYAYDANGRLEYVTYPDSSQRRYHYEHAISGLLTGITDENGTRFATYEYDSQGRVIVSEHAGGAQRYEFSYSGSGPPYSTVVEDPLGATRAFAATLVGDVIKPESITGSTCSGCGTQQVSYDANGNVSQRTDFAGNLTTYIFDPSRNLESSRTEAFGTARARTIATTWHPGYRLPAQIDEPGRRTTFTHDVSGNVLTKTVLDTATSETRN